MQAEAEFRGDAWLRYDTTLRTRAANRLLTRWSEINSTLWNHAFSGQSRASAFCGICMDGSHITPDCPLYPQGSVQRRTTPATSPTTSGGLDSHAPPWFKVVFNYYLAVDYPCKQPMFSVCKYYPTSCATGSQSGSCLEILLEYANS